MKDSRGITGPISMKSVRQFFRRHRLGREWRIVRHPAVMYKAQGARATDPGKDQGEANAPFVDNKLALFFSAVNGANPLFRMWWKFLDGVNMWLGRSKRRKPTPYCNAKLTKDA